MRNDNSPPAPAPDINAIVRAMRGVPNPAVAEPKTAENGIPEAPDLTARILAMRGVK